MYTHPQVYVILYGVEQMDQQRKCLLGKHEDLCSDPHVEILGVLVHVSKSSARA